MRERGSARLLILLCGAGVLLCAVGPAAGGVVDSDLAARLEVAGAGDRIPVIVRFAGQLDRSRLKSGSSRGSRRADLVRGLRARAASAQTPAREHLERRGVDGAVPLWAINGLAVAATADVIRELAGLPGVASVYLDAVVRAPREAEPKAAAEPEWNLEAIGAPELWARGHTGDGVVVAVVDTGVDALHQDLTDRYRGGPNSWFDPYGERGEPYDADGHGTQAAGLIVGGDAGGSAIGVAPGARWVAVKIFDDGGAGTLSRIHEGLQWLLDPDGDPDTDDMPDIANNSWGFPDQVGECYLEFADDIALLRAAGIAVVFSAGNTGPAPSSSISPGNNPGALAVGGVDDAGQVVSGSARGPSACGGDTFPSVVAPGASLRTADKTFGFPDSYAVVSGTSFAAPHASGALALLLTAHPGATLEQLEQSLAEGADDLGEDGPDDDSGEGVVDVVAAEQVLAKLVAPTATVYTTEAAFLAAVGNASTLQEGFEDDGAWGAARSPDAVPSVTSQGIAWSSNHPDNRISTSGGPAYSGDWALFSVPHGDQTVPNPTDFIEDGVVGRAAVRLMAVGGWFSGTSGGKLRLVLDGNDAGPLELGPIDAGHRFYGAVVDGSFSSFEFREAEGTLEDQKYVFADDVTLALADGGPTQAMTGVVAGVADVRGAQGSDWHTDLALHNASAGESQVELYFAPAGATVGVPIAVTVGAGHTESFADVVSTTFGASGSGAIFWRVTAGDPAALLVSANTYNRVDAVRRYGQQVPGVALEEAGPAGASIWVPALAGPYRTNLGFAVDGDCTRVRIRAVDRSGVVQAERTVAVEPYSWQQLNRLFRREFPELIADPDTVAVADSLHRFEVVGIGGRVVAYTSIIDNATSDGSYLLGQEPGSAGGSPWLPGAAFVRGVNASQWRSDVMIFNASAGADAAVVSYFPSDTDNGGGVASETLELAAGEGVFGGNVVRELFGARPPAVGSLGVTAAEGLLWMRTYTEEPGDGGFITYGQAIPPFDDGDAITAGTEGRVFGFTVDDRTRANLILQNTFRDAAGTLLPAAVAVEVLDRQGTVVHEESYALRAGEYLQHNGFIGDYGVGAMIGAALRVVVTDAPPEAASGGVLAMVSEVNGGTLAGTNDGRLLPAEVVTGLSPP